jgi:hypothetical protein
VYDSLQRGTAVTASGTSVDFTGIPSWVRRITVMFSGVSTNGTSEMLVQIGDSGGIETTGYDAIYGAIITSTAGTGNATTGFTLGVSTAATTRSGLVTITNLSGNIWVSSGNLYETTARIALIAGGKTLSATLDRVRITTVNGTDSFDAGTINILYE